MLPTRASQGPGPVDEWDEDEDPDLSFIDELRRLDDPDGDDPEDETRDPEDRRSGESPDDDRDVEPEPHPRP